MFRILRRVRAGQPEFLIFVCYIYAADTAHFGLPFCVAVNFDAVIFVRFQHTAVVRADLLDIEIVQRARLSALPYGPAAPCWCGTRFCPAQPKVFPALFFRPPLPQKRRQANRAGRRRWYTGGRGPCGSAPAHLCACAPAARRPLPPRPAGCRRSACPAICVPACGWSRSGAMWRQRPGRRGRKRHTAAVLGGSGSWPGSPKRTSTSSWRRSIRAVMSRPSGPPRSLSRLRSASARG